MNINIKKTMIVVAENKEYSINIAIIIDETTTNRNSQTFQIFRHIIEANRRLNSEITKSANKTGTFHELKKNLKSQRLNK